MMGKCEQVASGRVQKVGKRLHGRCLPVVPCQQASDSICMAICVILEVVHSRFTLVADSKCVHEGVVLEFTAE